MERLMQWLDSEMSLVRDCTLSITRASELVLGDIHLFMRCQVQSCLLDSFLADQVMTGLWVCRVQPSKQGSKLAIAVAELGLEHAFRPRHA